MYTEYTIAMTQRKMHLLVVCSRNKQRSLTAELIFAHHPNIIVRSAGTSPNARHTVSLSDINWADHILCMEKKHQALLKLKFSQQNLPPITMADIEDTYELMDPELVEMLKNAIHSIFNSFWSSMIYSKSWRKPTSLA